MSNVSIALGLYSVYRDLQQDLESTLRRVKKLGYEGVEFYGEFTHEPELIKGLLEELALTNCGWHTEWKLLQPDTIEATLDYHRRAGTRNIVIPALGGPWEIGHKQHEDRAEVWIRHAVRMNEIAQQVAAQGFRLGYHTHAHEFDTDFGGVTPWDLLCQHTDSSILLELDTGNCIEAGADPAEVIAAVPGRPLLVHGKPYSRTDGHETFIGDIKDENNWSQIITQCERAGTEWLIVEHESEAAYPGFIGVERCLEGLRAVLAERQ
ncbi:sugar phosphate isomerase/epimerase [Paenibacillus sp. 1011MAR3C5]|uniref:sugar phosphate isomerase/epimerase family protein n=1 Tax=Paenibacillus sp. 1011MAR3C5 TaxID=1675787 RepID=UPI000E6CACA0|nr:sugar phosphate isomerase/epimerase [Paenibacillus sp. 1011MAR3C5]RJE91169.1 sugar phosphate isomerase/epimerase [Paenibacillus sp. 1011MAR3C5]